MLEYSSSIWLRGTENKREITDIVEIMGLDFLLKGLLFLEKLSGDLGLVLLGFEDLGLLEVLFLLLFFLFKGVQIFSSLADVLSQHFIMLVY